MDFWESNGPVHVWGILDRLVIETRETIAAGLLLLRLGWSAMDITEDARRLLTSPDEQWTDVAAAIQSFVLGSRTAPPGGQQG
jgi:hypothetical protein